VDRDGDGNLNNIIFGKTYSPKSLTLVGVADRKPTILFSPTNPGELIAMSMGGSGDCLVKILERKKIC